MSTRCFVRLEFRLRELELGELDLEALEFITIITSHDSLLMMSLVMSKRVMYTIITYSSYDF